jgi:hypothetical protein
LELEKAAKHGAQHGVKIKKTWDSADGYVMLAMLASLQAVPAAQQAWASMLVGETHAPSSFMPTP